MGDDDSSLCSFDTLHFSELKRNKKLLHKVWHLTNPLLQDGMRLAIKEFIKGDILDGYAVIARNGDEVLGWASLDLEDEADPPYYNINVYVDEKYRGLGIGKKLTEKAREVVKPYPIKAYPQDQAGQNLYTGSNFEVVYTKPA